MELRWLLNGRRPRGALTLKKSVWSQTVSVEAVSPAIESRCRRSRVWLRGRSPRVGEREAMGGRVDSRRMCPSGGRGSLRLLASTWVRQGCTSRWSKKTKWKGASGGIKRRTQARCSCQREGRRWPEERRWAKSDAAGQKCV